MNLFGLTVRSPFVRGKDFVDNPRWWNRITEPFTGAWQRNIECDAAATVLAFSAVYACITRISNDIATMPLNLVRQDGDGIWNAADSSSPFWRPLRKPNNYQNRIQFFVSWLLSKLINGNTYVLKERDGRGMVVALYVLDPTKVTCRWLPDGRVFYQLRTDELALIREGVTVPASEIIHDLMNPLFHPLCGVSPLYACGMAATQGNRIQRNSALTFENYNVPSGVLTASTDLDDAQGDKWSREWKEKFTGSKRGSVAILGNGLKYEKISMTSEESQLIEQLRWTGEDVARAFGVPGYKIGVAPVPPVGNAEALNTQYYNDVLRPLIESIEIGVDEGLGIGPTYAQNADLGTMFDLDTLWRMDSSTQIDLVQKAVGAAIFSPDEGRKRFNMKPVAGGSSPMIQQQNYSLAALAKRDASDDPFGTAKAKEPAKLPDAAPPDLDAEKNALIALRVELNRIARGAIGLETR